MNTKYAALQTIAGIIRAFGYIVFVLGAIYAIAALFTIPGFVSKIGWLVIRAVGAGLYGLFLLAWADVLIIAMDIEENTRKSKEYLERMAVKKEE